MIYDLQRSFNPLDEKLKWIQFDRLHFKYLLHNTYYNSYISIQKSFTYILLPLCCLYPAFILPWCWEYPAIWNCLCSMVNVIRFFSFLLSHWVNFRFIKKENCIEMSFLCQFYVPMWWIFFFVISSFHFFIHFLFI